MTFKSALGAADKYLDVLREWTVGRIGLLWLLIALAFLPYVVTSRLVQSGIIGEEMGIAIRIPLLAIAIIYFLWAAQYQLKQVVRIFS